MVGGLEDEHMRVGRLSGAGVFSNQGLTNRRTGHILKQRHKQLQAPRAIAPAAAAAELRTPARRQQPLEAGAACNGAPARNGARPAPTVSESPMM